MPTDAKPLDEQWKGGHKTHFDQREKRVRIATKCLRLVRDIAPMDSVVDFGCGIGAWLVAARELGAGRVLGIEGDWVKKTETILPTEEYRYMDLSKDTVNFKKQFSLAMTIEVIEHVPTEASDGFCQNLVNASDYILFSAAIPGQGGIGHINEQPLAYWIEKFWALNYVPLEVIRPYVTQDPDVFWWLRQNMIMFVSYAEFLRSIEKLGRFARPLNDFNLKYVSAKK